jgi:hypothetical protein
MLTVASLSRRQLETRLAGPGLAVQTGAFRCATVPLVVLLTGVLNTASAT